MPSKKKKSFGIECYMLNDSDYGSGSDSTLSFTKDVFGEEEKENYYCEHPKKWHNGTLALTFFLSFFHSIQFDSFLSFFRSTLYFSEALRFSGTSKIVTSTHAMQQQQQPATRTHTQQNITSDLILSNSNPFVRYKI